MKHARMMLHPTATGLLSKDQKCKHKSCPLCKNVIHTVHEFGT